MKGSTISRKVLLVLANAAQAHAVRGSLANSRDGPFKVEWVSRCAGAMERLGDQRGRGIAAIVVDLFLPDSQGIETFNTLSRASPHIPILVLSHLRDEGVARLAVQHGAQDYLLAEHLDHPSLSKALNNMLERSAYVGASLRERERAQVTLNSIGDAVISTDMAGNVTYLNPVAELPNRMLLNDRLTQAIAAARRHRTSLAVMFVDVDHFKHINDSLGHTAGDQLLKSVARRLVACVRTSDTVSRHGGDEFVVLLSEVGRAEDASLSADKVIAALSAPHRIGHQDLRVTVSVGIGVYPDDGMDAETLLKNADTAPLHAKAHGRGNHKFFQRDRNVRPRMRASESRTAVQ